MGIWGENLYQDDITLDIKDEYKDKLRKGKTNEEVLHEIIDENREIIEDMDEAHLFWFALADTQWNLGRLDEYVKEKALEHIEIQANLLNWREDVNLSLERLERLKEKLLSTQPKERRISKYKLYKCKWKTGDTFAYKLEGKETIKNGLNNKYLIIQKVDELEWYHGDIIPIVRIKITKDIVVPDTENEINQLEYIQTDYCQYEKRFWGMSASIPLEKQIEGKTFETDEYGLLPEFLLAIVITPKLENAFQEKLKYIGNYENIKLPEREFIPLNKLNITTVKCNEFEKEVIEKYLGNNKRQFGIYNKRDL